MTHIFNRIRNLTFIASAILLVSLLLNSCSTLKTSMSASSKWQNGELPVDSAAYKDVVYKTVDGRSLALDIYMPHYIKAGTKVPVLMYVHGGAWVWGNKTAIRYTFRQYIMRQLLNSGIAIASIDYRLVDSTSVHLAQQISDCKDAVRWMRLHGSEYGIDSDNIGIAGASAGGHLALMTGFTNDSEFVGDAVLSGVSAKVNYIVDYFGPTDMNATYHCNLNALFLSILRHKMPDLYKTRNDQLYRLSGYDVEKQKKQVVEECKKCSPISYISAKCPPVIILHGTGDRLVNFNQSVDLQKRLKKAGVECELIRYPGLEHSFPNATKAQAEDIAAQTQRFIHTHTNVAINK